MPSVFSDPVVVGSNKFTLFLMLKKPKHLSLFLVVMSFCFYMDLPTAPVIISQSSMRLIWEYFALGKLCWICPITFLSFVCSEFVHCISFPTEQWTPTPISFSFAAPLLLESSFLHFTFLACFNSAKLWLS